MIFKLGFYNDFSPGDKTRMQHLTRDPGVMRNWIAMISQHVDNDMYCAVAEKEGLILGWACAFHHYEQPEGLYNLGVFVAPPYRNQRIGSTVLATIVRTLHKGRFYFDPGTEEQNPLGRKLYMPYKGDPRFYTRPSVAL